VALDAAVAAESSGFNLQMWATIVDRDGVVCAVAFSGIDRGAQWPGSRVISAQKANTANAFSLPALALSTADLYSATQPGGSLFGLQESNPVDTGVAYGGNPANNGRERSDDRRTDWRHQRLRRRARVVLQRQIVGGLGVSGDSSCADHNIAWRTRHNLNLDFVPGGVGPDGRPDNIVYDILRKAGQMPGVSASGWDHPRAARAQRSQPSCLGQID
jgi:uncharacterized protein GlcG (DUF336 family)